MLEDVRIGQLPQQVRDALRGSCAERKKGGLLRLTRLEGRQQLEEARRLATGGPKRAGKKAIRTESPATVTDTPTLSASTPVGTPPFPSGTGYLAAEPNSAVSARLHLSRLLDVAGYPPIEQAAMLLGKVGSLLHVALERAPELNRASIATIVQNVAQCASCLEEHHVMRANCDCGADPQCPRCVGKQWLSWADQRRVAGSAHAS